MVRTERLELSHLAAPEPKPGVSTNFTTSAFSASAPELSQNSKSLIFIVFYKNIVAQAAKGADSATVTSRVQQFCGTFSIRHWFRAGAIPRRENQPAKGLDPQGLILAPPHPVE